MSIFSGIGAIFTQGSADRNRRRQLNELKKNQALWNALLTPSIENLQMGVQQEISQGRLNPELGQAILSDPSAMAEVGANPELVRAQEASLGALQNIARQGGMDTQSRANLAQIQDQLGQQERGQREALLAQQQRQGTIGSGQGLAAQLLAQQQSAGRAGQAGFQQAASADQRALEALIQSGQMAGQMRTQQVGEAERRAAAEDRINRFNTAHRRQLQQSNLATLNAAEAANLRDRVNRDSRNVGRRQQGAQQHADAYRQKYLIDADKVAGQTRSGRAIADVRGQKANLMEQRTGKLLEDAADSADKIATAGLGAADGAVVPGQNYAGDRVDAQLNSGEMVLNVNQQQNLLDLLSGKTNSINTEEPIVQENMPEDPLAILANMSKQNMADGGVVPPQYKDTDALVRKWLEDNPQYIYGEGGQISPEVKTAPLPWDKYSSQTQAGAGATPVDTTSMPEFAKPPTAMEKTVTDIMTKPPVTPTSPSTEVPPTPPVQDVAPTTAPPTAPTTQQPTTATTQPEQEKQDIIEMLLGLDAGRTTGQKVAGGVGGALRALSLAAGGDLPKTGDNQFDEAARLANYKSMLEEQKYQRRRGDKLTDQEMMDEKKAEREREANKSPKTYKDLLKKHGNTDTTKQRFGQFQSMITNFVKLEKLMTEDYKILPGWHNKAKKALTAMMEPWLRINTGAQVNKDEFKRLMALGPSELNDALHGKGTGAFSMGLIKDFINQNISSYTKGDASLGTFAYMLKNRPNAEFPKQAANSLIRMIPTDQTDVEDLSKIDDIDAEIAKEEAKLKKK